MLDSLPDGPFCINGTYPLYKSASVTPLGNEQHAMALPLTYCEAESTYHHARRLMGQMNDGVHTSCTEVTYTFYHPMDNAAMTNPTHGHGSHGVAHGCPHGTLDASSIWQLPETSFCVRGLYPLYKSSYLSNMASPVSRIVRLPALSQSSPPRSPCGVESSAALALQVNASHAHPFGNFTLYMPNGVAMVHDEAAGCPQSMHDGSEVVFGGGAHDHSEHSGNVGGNHNGNMGGDGTAEPSPTPSQGLSDAGIACIAAAVVPATVLLVVSLAWMVKSVSSQSPVPAVKASVAKEGTGSAV